MSYQKERDHFMARCQLSPETARALLRHATTLQRLSEAQCNGDWPADNGERKVKPCPLCESQWVPSQIQGGTAARLAWIHAGEQVGNDPANPRACPDCRTEARVHALLDGTQWQAWTQGDPRGYVLRLFPRRVPECLECHERAHRDGGSIIHKGKCISGKLPETERGTMADVTRDDMDCNRVSALGVPTR